jgi:hypothetical protein
VKLSLGFEHFEALSSVKCQRQMGFVMFEQQSEIDKEMKTGFVYLSPRFHDKSPHPSSAVQVQPSTALFFLVFLFYFLFFIFWILMFLFFSCDFNSTKAP